MKMKRISNTLGILLMSLSFIFIVSCSKDDADEIPELKLSTDNGTVYTDATEYSFDIISGAGDYIVKIEDDNQPTLGKVSLTGNHVKVDLISEQTRLTITDKHNQTTDLLIISSNESIQTENYTVLISYGSLHKATVNWGAGKYSILKQSGDAAELTIDNNDKFTIRSIHPGKASFTIADQRGTTNGIMVYVDNGWDLTSDKLTVDVLAGQLYTFPIKYGKDGWKITSYSSELLNHWQTCVMPEDANYREQEILQVWIPKEAKESLSVQLKDKANNTATITMNLK